MKLNATDLKTISAALSDAIRWRDSLADAHHRTGPEAVAAALSVERYERLHVKVLARPSAVAIQEEKDRTTTRVSIFDLDHLKDHAI